MAFAVMGFAALSMGATCNLVPGGGGQNPPPNPVDPPVVSVTLNAVVGELNDLLIVPPSGFVINASWQAVDTPVVPSTLFAAIYAADGSGYGLGSLMQHIGPDGAIAVFPSLIPLPMGSYQLVVRVKDEDGSQGEAVYDFAVREHSPPIGSDQIIWYDFDADRDGTPGPDFDANLEQFGFTSPAAPALQALMRDRVIGALLDRVAAVYFDGNPNLLPGGDPIFVTLVTEDGGLPSTTRICVGGDAGVYGLVGSILLDPDNGNRASVECGTLPPTGIFPAGLTAFSSAPGFQQYLDPIRPAAGGTPVGEDPLDAIVLDPAFDPATATAAELAREIEINDAVDVFGDVLGSIVAHETGHALGLVEPAAPGIGLWGGQSGPEFTHNVMADGSTPTQNFLMNAGNTFSFESLGGLAGFPLPVFRPLNHAYLRDRAVIDPFVTEIVPGPDMTGVMPSVVTSSLQTLTITGANFVDTPSVRLVTSSWVHEAHSEVLVSPTEMRATVSKSFLYPGAYTLELTNPDGQWVEMPGAIWVP